MSVVVYVRPTDELLVCLPADWSKKCTIIADASDRKLFSKYQTGLVLFCDIFFNFMSANT